MQNLEKVSREILEEALVSHQKLCERLLRITVMLVKNIVCKMYHNL